MREAAGDCCLLPGSLIANLVSWCQLVYGVRNYPSFRYVFGRNLWIIRKALFKAPFLMMQAEVQVGI